MRIRAELLCDGTLEGGMPCPAVVPVIVEIDASGDHPQIESVYVSATAPAWREVYAVPFGGGFRQRCSLCPTCAAARP